MEDERQPVFVFVVCCIGECVLCGQQQQQRALRNVAAVKRCSAPRGVVLPQQQKPGACLLQDQLVSVNHHNFTGALTLGSLCF
jgi:hypothetical protein